MIQKKDSFESLNSDIDRLDFLKNLKKNNDYLDISNIKEWLSFPLSLHEKYLILDLNHPNQKTEFEEFLVHYLFSWDQNLSAHGLDCWASNTERILSSSLLAAFQKKIATQRILFKMLQYSHFFPRTMILDIVSENKETLDFSPAFHNLFFKTALKNGYTSLSLDQIYKNYQMTFFAEDGMNASSDKMPIELFMTLTHWTISKGNKWDIENKNIWVHLLNLLRNHSVGDKFSLPKVQDFTKEILNQITQKTPHWKFDTINQNDVKYLMTLKLEKMINWDEQGELLSLLPLSLIEHSITQLSNFNYFTELSTRFPEAFCWPFKQAILDHLNSLLEDDHVNSIDKMPGHLRKSMNSSFNNFEQFTKGDFWEIVLKDAKLEEQSISTPNEISAKDAFIRVALLKEPLPDCRIIFDDFWTSLLSSFLVPEEDKLDDLAIMARSVNPFNRMAFLHTLGRFTGSQKAVLKLIEFKHSTDSAVIKIIGDSLASINTEHSKQELLSLMSKSTNSQDNTSYLANLLLQLDLSAIQSELKSTLDDFKSTDDQHLKEIADTLSIKIDINKKDEAPPKGEGGLSLDKKEIDQLIKGYINQFDDLTPDIKRPLRTAMFFHQNIENLKESDHIDLSPIIDMQYKALELLFRESFEDICYKIISEGGLQKKLDVIGYSRPVPESMSRFENYLADLEVIKTIPFFSKFKLRKLLRSLCQFRPGKRFTFDGLKAFALFFLAFGRSQCKFGMQRTIAHGFQSDQELFKFCKQLHVFQDFRNRAAHEGMRPESRENPESIWQQSNEIIIKALLLKPSLQASQATEIKKGGRNVS